MWQRSYVLLLIQCGGVGGPAAACSAACFINQWYLGSTGLGCGPPATHLSVSPPCPVLLPQGRAGSLQTNPSDPEMLATAELRWAGLPSRAAISQAWRICKHPVQIPAFTELWVPLSDTSPRPHVFCSELGPFRTEFALIISHSKRSCLHFVGSSFSTRKLIKLCTQQCPWWSRRLPKKSTCSDRVRRGSGVTHTGAVTSDAPSEKPVRNSFSSTLCGFLSDGLAVAGHWDPQISSPWT